MSWEAKADATVEHLHRRPSVSVVDKCIYIYYLVVKLGQLHYDH
jgi:hypothetical protein